MKRPRGSGSRASVAFAVALLVVFAVLTLAACGGSGSAASSSPSEEALLTAEPTESAIPLPTPTVTGTIAFTKVVEQGEYETTLMADIYVVNADGAGLTRLTDDPHWEDHPSWSPDGRRIAYTEYSTSISLPEVGLADGNVWVMNADGSGKVRLTKGSRSAGGSGGWPSWSPDGKQIAFVTYTGSKKWDWAIDVMNADGSARKRVSDGSGNDLSPSWTPDGRIIFVRDKPAGTYAVDPDGTGLVRLAKTGYDACSPDGRSLCISDGDRVQVVRMRGGGTPVTLLHPIFDFMTGECGAAWTPDGKALVLAANFWSSSGSRLYVVNADGSGLSAVPGVDGGNGPVWRPR
jgi:Tol biopolymer transport system component